MEKEKSCGIVVFNNNTVLIVKHNVGHYGIPKGHVEDGETEQETAIREVKEETNIDAEIIGDFRKKITYSPKKNVLKDVYFFAGIATSFELTKPNDEIALAMFVPFEDAFKYITRRNERKVLKAAIDYYKKKII